jgi:hypothetical protein
LRSAVGWRNFVIRPGLVKSGITRQELKSDKAALRTSVLAKLQGFPIPASIGGLLSSNERLVAIFLSRSMTRRPLAVDSVFDGETDGNVGSQESDGVKVKPCESG